MDILDNYLDTMFSRYPLTAKTQEAKAELRAMMEDAYTGALAAGKSHNEAVGLAISEFGNIEEVAPLLGLSPSEPGGYQTGTVPGSLPNAMPSQGAWNEPAPVRPVRPITLSQAKNYAEVLRRTRWLLGAGVALLVIAPATLMSLATATGESGGATKVVGLVVGLAVLIPFTAVGIGLLIWRNQQLTPFKRVLERSDYCPPEVESWVRALRDGQSGPRTRGLIIAIGFWVLAAFPLIAAGIITDGWDQGDANPLLGIALLIALLLTAVGLVIFLPSNWAATAAAGLLTLAPGTPENLAEDDDYERFPTWARVGFAGWWPLVTLVFLTWGLVWDAWDVAWIVWPIAALLFGTFAAVVGTAYRGPRNRISGN